MDFGRDWWDRHVQTGGPLFDVKAACGGSLLNGATGQHGQQHPDCEGQTTGTKRAESEACLSAFMTLIPNM